MKSADGILSLSNRRHLLVPYGVEPKTTLNCGPTSEFLSRFSKKRVALYLSRVHPKKNVNLLVEAWHLARVSKDWVLVIAGDGPIEYVNAIDAQIRRLGLSEQVFMVGHVDGEDKAYLLQTARWFLLPSSHENFGVAVVEAISAGCAVAISNEVFLADYLPSDAIVLPVDIGVWKSFISNHSCPN